MVEKEIEQIEVVEEDRRVQENQCVGAPRTLGQETRPRPPKRYYFTTDSFIAPIIQCLA
jgi:hypothetical protein